MFKIKDAVNRLVKESKGRAVALKDARKQVYRLYCAHVEKGAGGKKGGEKPESKEAFKATFAAKVASSTKIVLKGGVTLEWAAGKRR